MDYVLVLVKTKFNHGDLFFCRHEFHKLCIDPWLVEHRTCPMCKLNILKELGLVSIFNGYNFQALYN